ncbi:MAG: hypothetical protein ACFCD0_10125 [Gemmataceae bacterium]
MWLWESELRELKFKPKSEHYWQCDRGYDLPSAAYLSIYPWSTRTHPALGISICEMTAFHVTFLLDTEHVHYYYHERQDREWEPGGHTSTKEILRVHPAPKQLRHQADQIASRLIDAMGCQFREREKK